MTDDSPANTLLSLRDLGSSIRGDLKRTGLLIALFQTLFKMLTTAALTPIALWMLSLLLRRTGYVAVGNEEALEFLLSPTGVCYAAMFTLMLFGSLLVESAGVTAIAAWKRCDEQTLSWRVAVRLPYYVSLVLRLGATQAAVATALAAPLVALTATLYVTLLSQYDVNYYLSARPPVFYAATGGAILLAAGFVVVAVALGVRWSLAAPILLFEKPHVFAAMRESWKRTRPFAGRLGLTLVLWHASVFVLGALGVAIFVFAADAAIDAAGERLGVALPLAATLLVMQTVLVLTPSAIGMAGHSLIVFAYYATGNETFETKLHQHALPPPKGFVFHWRRKLALAVIVLLGGMIWGLSQLTVDWRPPAITSHRGHGNYAPENTLAAIRQAIDARADFVEIDVQLTRDGAIVLVHDRDMKRLADSPLRPEDATLAELRALDLGRGFGGRFAGEKIATLDEALDLAQGRIKVNIELKVYGKSLAIADRVVDVIERRGLQSDCLVTSLHYGALLEVEKRNPLVTTGLIVGASLGDVSKLHVDVLSVRADLVTRRFLRHARQAGKRIHVWTVNSPTVAARLMSLGVENLITDEPGRLVPLRDERARLSDVEQLLLAAKYTLELKR